MFASGVDARGRRVACCRTWEGGGQEFLLDDGGLAELPITPIRDPADEIDRLRQVAEQHNTGAIASVPWPRTA